MEESLTAAGAAPATAPTPAMDDGKRNRSRGEKLFDGVVYGGLAGVGTFIVTLALTYWLKYGAPSVKVEGLATKIEHRLSRFFSPERSKSIAQNVTMTGMLMQGGNAMLLPIALAEKNKEALVAKANSMLGDDTPSQEIVKAPPQTLLSLVQGRLAAFAVVWASLQAASGLFEKSFAMFSQEFAELSCKLFRKPISVIGKDGKSVPSKAYRYGEMAAVDTFATVAAASLLYVGGHFFARRHEEKKAQAPLRQNHGGVFREGAMGDTAEMPELVTKKTAPLAVIAGEKQHAGAVAAPERTQAL